MRSETYLCALRFLRQRQGDDPQRGQANGLIPGDRDEVHGGRTRQVEAGGNGEPHEKRALRERPTETCRFDERLTYRKTGQPSACTASTKASSCTQLTWKWRFGSFIWL